MNGAPSLQIIGAFLWRNGFMSMFITPWSRGRAPLTTRGEAKSIFKSTAIATLLALLLAFSPGDSMILEMTNFAESVRSPAYTVDVTPVLGKYITVGMEASRAEKLLEKTGFTISSRY